MSSEINAIRGKFAWLTTRFLKRIWVRATAFSLAAVAVALLAAFAGPYIPYDPNLTLASGAVDDILNVLATSMLAVTTFSLSIMVSAYSSATSQATPRSTKLMLADPTAQNTLSTFVGTFLFSIVGIIGLAAGLYQSKGRIILFFATILVIVIVIVTLLRWIEQLGRFGRIGDTIRRVERAARDALVQAGRSPSLGARLCIRIPAGAGPVVPSRSGRLQHVDVGELEEQAAKGDFDIYLAAMIGDPVHPAAPVLHTSRPVTDEERTALLDSLSIGDDREFEDDPRFGMIVLSEIASRALSPAVNDPGTAIEVCDAALRLLGAYGAAAESSEQPACRRIFAPQLDAAELVSAFANPVARDGAATVEVQLRLIATLVALVDWWPDLYRSAAREHARRIVERSQDAMALADDRAALRKAAAPLLGAAEPDEPRAS